MEDLCTSLLKAFREIGQLQNNQKVVDLANKYLEEKKKQKKMSNSSKFSGCKRVAQENLEE